MVSSTSTASATLPRKAGACLAEVAVTVGRTACMLAYLVEMLTSED